MKYERLYPLPTRRLPYKTFSVAGLLLFSFTFLYWTFGLPTKHKYPPRPIEPLPQADLDVFAAHAIDNTVVIVPVNSGMLDLAENMLCSLAATDFDASSIVFWALDDGARQKLNDSGHATYYNPALFAVSTNENIDTGTGDYYRMMKERPKFFRQFLASGFDMLMLDADIVFYQSPLKLVPDAAHKPGIDIAYSTDAREFFTMHDAFDDRLRKGPYMPPICNGQFWMKSNNETIALWTEMLDVFEDPDSSRSGRFHDDQRGMDVMLNDGRAKVVEPFPGGITADKVPRVKNERGIKLRVQLLDQTQVVNGELYMFHEEAYETQLAELRQQGKDRISVHMNWNVEVMTKSEGAAKKGLNLLDQNGKCSKLK